MSGYLTFSEDSSVTAQAVPAPTFSCQIPAEVVTNQL